VYVLEVAGYARVVLYAQHGRGEALTRETARTFASIIAECHRLPADAVGVVLKYGREVRRVDRKLRVWAGARLLFTDTGPPPRKPVR
jgi:hypothetical protein